jgi:antitoxin (DNA-binding transcriptional repressor) of toxin-antitoxin stability system
MATIHISRAEAAGDFDRLITRASNGDEIVIEENASPVVVLRAAARPRVRLLSESLKILEDRGATVTLDGGFEHDLNAVIESHREPLIDPMNDPWA